MKKMTDKEIEDFIKLQNKYRKANWLGQFIANMTIFTIMVILLRIIMWGFGLSYPWQ